MRVIIFFLSVAVLFSLADPLLAQTRYSAAEPARAAAPAESMARAAPKLRLLSWPGKVAFAAPAPVSAAPPAQVPAPRAAMSPSAPAAPFQPQIAQPRIAQPQAALPASIYAPAPPAPARPAPQVQALALAGPAYPTARQYSVHRQYGGSPDPVALTPQFFNDASADLAEPPPPAARTFTTTGGRVVRAAPAPASGD
jgi:hypothetical protein